MFLNVGCPIANAPGSVPVPVSANAVIALPGSIETATATANAFVANFRFLFFPITFSFSVLILLQSHYSVIDCFQKLHYLKEGVLSYSIILIYLMPQTEKPLYF
ncbi:MAG: hypothetical protein RHS_4667 [Robinsoniella sp. RHS]|nr:MAG: hypothetical protein RHS_4667 [Robinsoniella sp. RHS]